jgi:hypothetical protein
MVPVNGLSRSCIVAFEHTIALGHGVSGDCGGGPGKGARAERAEAIEGW